jgi:uncharacterized protein YegL
VSRFEDKSPKKRVISAILCILFILNALFIGLSNQIPQTSAASVSHTVGNVEVNMFTDWGRIFMPIRWNGMRQTLEDQGTPLGFIGLVVDHDNYDHTPGAEDIADSFTSYPYTSEDDFKPDNPINMVVDDGTIQKSYGSFQNKGTGTGFPDDLLINQTAWTVKNRDWAILQWTLSNVKSPASTLTNVRIGLEVPISKEGGRYNLGGSIGDFGDDVDGYDAVDDIYWARDTGDGTTIGFSSAIVSDPITHYYAEDYHADYSSEYLNFFADDTWLYQRISAPNATATNGITPQNITATVGWDGFDIASGKSKTVTLVIAINSSFNNMKTALKDAQNYYKYRVTGFRITEISDDPANQQIEVYNVGRAPTDLQSEGYFLSLNGITPLPGTWTPTIIQTYEHAVFDVTGAPLDPEADTIGLYQDQGGGNIVLMDEVSYGLSGRAPDPLVSESTSCYWNAIYRIYSDDWLREDTPTFGTHNDVAPINPTPSIVLNEVMFNPSTANGGYLTLYNKEPGFSVNVRDYYIVCDTVYQLSGMGDIILEPLSTLFIYYSDNPSLFDNMNQAGDNVYLYDNYGELLDMVGWNSGHSEGMSVRRVPDGGGTYQGYRDTTSEAAGWVFNSPLEIFITEISDSESVNSQIEIYNPLYPPVDFRAGFTFESRSSGFLFGSWIIPIADRGQYALFRVNTPNGLAPEGDTITFNQNTALIETISYGTKGLVPDPLKDESVQRYFNGQAYTDMWGRNWTSGPNFGAQNNIPPAKFNMQLKLNEILFNPNVASDGFVEIFLVFGLLNISGYKIVGDSEYIIPQGTELSKSDPFFYLLQPADPSFFNGISPVGDNVYLYDNNGSLLDMVGWSSQHTKGKSASRMPSGNGTENGFDDTSSAFSGWFFDMPPSIHLVKLYTNEPVMYGSFCSVIYYTVNVKNKQSVDDTVLFYNSTLNGYSVIILDETGTFPISKLFVAAQSNVNFMVMVILPSEVPFSEWDNITIAIQSENSTLYRDSIIIEAVVTPFIWPEKSVSPQEIYYNGTGHDEVTTITLNLTGMGSKIKLVQPQDVMFCVDTSGSMTQMAIDIIKFGLMGYVDEMSIPDTGAVVIFGGTAWLMNPLTNNYTELRMDIGNIPGPLGGTPMGDAMNISIDELLLNGNSSHIQVIILLTDGGNNMGSHDPIIEAHNAADNNITIFTIGLEPIAPYVLDENTLKEIANITGGLYFYADNPSLIPQIYKVIADYIGDIAGRDLDITDAIPMVRDVLPPWMILVEDSFTIDPDVNYVNETGYRILEWNISSILIGEKWEVSFQVKSTKLGWVHTNDFNASRVYYVDYFDGENFRSFPECIANVLPPDPLPPKLYIDILPNKDDIYLYWDEPVSIGTHHFLIYRSTSPNDFDFSKPWVDTNDTLANGRDPIDGLVIPRRGSWNHTKAADPANSEYSQQMYYCIRTVNYRGQISHTSRTVGKWTRIFDTQKATFSLPLEPLEVKDSEFYAQDMNADFIRWMDPVNHTWVKHDKGTSVNNAEIVVGSGYEVFLSLRNAKYTFLGMPGAMIRYNTKPFVGFDYSSDAKSLTALVDSVSGDVTLTWPSPSGMDSDDFYHVYYSTTRDGFNGFEGIDYHLLPRPYDIISVNDARIAVHVNAVSLYNEIYYMVIPVNENNVKGASTYSIGVWTKNYLKEYDTIGIPLILDSYPTLDWYCDNMDDVIGINYYINAELRWGWHKTEMPQGAYDPVLDITYGYQLSTNSANKYTFIGR